VEIDITKTFTKKLRLCTVECIIVLKRLPKLIVFFMTNFGRREEYLRIIILVLVFYVMKITKRDKKFETNTLINGLS